ncbi:MAG: MFS transporter [Alphaproteobacteria bacterium]|nr:MFS transporter [Alphaproteobacteria bacterium]
MHKQVPGAGTPRYSTSYIWYATVVLTVAATLSFIDRQVLAVMIEPVKQDLHITDTQVALLLGLAFVSFYTALSIPAGWLADRFSRRLVMGVGVFLWSLMTAFSGVAHTYPHLFLARMGVGVGEALLAPAAYSMLTDYFSREKLPAAISLFSASPFIGVGLAFMLGGPLTEYLHAVPPIDLPVVGQVFSWQLTFLAVGVPGILLSVLVLLLKEPQRRGRLAVAEDPTGAPRTVPMIEIVRFIGSRWKYFALHFAAFLCLSTQGFALFAWIISFFVRVHGMGRGEIGLLYGGIALVVGLAGSMASGLYAGSMIRRGTPDATLRLVMWSAVFVAPLAVAMTLVPSPWLAVVLLVPITFFMSMPPGLGNASLQVIAPNELRGQVMAFYLITVNFLSYLFAPLVVALLNDHVFLGDASIGFSLSTMAAFTYPTAAICLAFGLKHYRAALRHAEDWEA